MCCYSFSLPQWCIHVCFFLVPLSGLCVLTLGPVIPCAYMQSTSPSVLCCVVPHGCVLPHSMFAFLMQRFGSSSLFTCFFFHFSLIKPVMSLLLDSLSLVFGSKLCLAGFSLLLLRPLASEKVGRPSCMEIQACQGSQMIGWPGNCAHPTGCRSLMQLHEWSTGVGCPFCLCVAALMISGLCICMCHLNAHWLYLPG